MSFFVAQFFSASQRRLHYLRVIPLTLAVCLIHACGFQLRGALDLSQDISPIYIQQESAFELAREIKTLLSTNNIAIVKSASEANAQLTLLNEVKSSRVLSVDANGRAREYLLSYKVNYALKTKQAEEAQEAISLSRNLVFDPDAVLATSNESEILYKDMQRDASRLMLLKLQAHSRNMPANKPTSDKSPASTPSESLNSQ